MQPRLILFDIDGTLIDTAGAGRRAMERAFHGVFGLDGVSARAAGVRYAGMTDPVILRAIADAVGIGPIDFAARSERLELAYATAIDEEMAREDPRRRTLPGVRELLGALADRREVHLGLITGNFERGARAKLEPFGLNRYFAGGGFASDHPDRREIARLACSKVAALAGIDFPSDRVVVIGDTEHDVDCARVNGFRAVAVASGWIDRAELERAEPDVLLDDLADTVRALSAVGLDEALGA